MQINKVFVCCFTRDTNIVKYTNYKKVELYYEIGASINELIEKHNLESSQNEIIKMFSIRLTNEFGEGFSIPILKNEENLPNI